MKKLLVLILIMLAYMAAGCSDNDSVTGDGNGVGGSYTVSGKVVDSSGAGISGVSITLTGETAEKAAGENVNLSVSTNNDGSYTFQNIKNGSYVVTASKSGLGIEPSNRTVEVNGSNVTVPDFTESADTNGGGGDGDGGGDGGDGGDGGGGGDGGTGSGNAGSHTYFPMKKGATWTYHVTDTDVVNNYTDEYDYTISITGTEVVDGKEYWVMVDEYGDFDSYYRLEDGVMYVYGGDDVYAKIPKMLAKAVGAGKAFEEVNPLYSEISMIDLNAGIGQIFDIMDYTDSSSGMNITIKMTGKYVGNKNISTAAGNFNNCRQYELVTEISVTSELYSSSSISTSETYLAPNVGYVKSTDKEYEEGELWQMSDEELTSYNIP